MAKMMNSSLLRHTVMMVHLWGWRATIFVVVPSCVVVVPLSYHLGPMVKNDDTTPSLSIVIIWNFCCHIALFLSSCCCHQTVIVVVHAFVHC